MQAQTDGVEQQTLLQLLQAQLQNSTPPLPSTLLALAELGRAHLVRTSSQGCGWKGYAGFRCSNSQSQSLL